MTPMLQMLHSGWLMRDSRARRWLPATVPGCVHTDLLANGEIPDPFWGRNEQELQYLDEQDWTYRLDFTPEAELLEQVCIDLVAEGLDTVASVVLNGEKLADTDNMFVEHRLPVKGHLKPGKNRLEIHFTSPMKTIRTRMGNQPPVEWNDPVGGSSWLRKQPCSFGWDWGPRFATSGIWRPLYLRGWSGNRFTSVRVRQDHGADGVRLTFPQPRPQGQRLAARDAVPARRSCRGVHRRHRPDRKARAVVAQRPRPAAALYRASGVGLP